MSIMDTVENWGENRKDTWSELDSEICQIYFQLKTDEEKEYFWQEYNPGQLLLWLRKETRERLQKQLEIEKEESGY